MNRNPPNNPRDSTPSARVVILQLSERVTQSEKIVPQAATNAAMNELEALQDQIIAGHQEIDCLMAQTVLKAIKIGDCILQAKGLLPHGAYLTWIDQVLTPVCGIKRRTVQRYTNLALNKHELVERARTYFGKQHDMPEPEVNELLRAMRINDAVKLLALPKAESKTKSSTESIVENEQDISILHVLTSQLLGRLADADSSRALDDDTEASLLDQAESCLFTSAGNATTNLAAVTAAAGTFRRGTSPAIVLALTYEGIERWISLVESYPHIHLRDGEGKTVPASSPFDLIVGLVHESQQDVFVEAFGRLGSAFVPHRTPKSCVITTLIGDRANVGNS